MIKCRKCGYENLDGLKYCENCGADLSVTESESDQEGSEKVKCFYCGNLNDSGNKVCEICGEPIGQKQANSQPDEECGEKSEDTEPTQITIVTPTIPSLSPQSVVGSPVTSLQGKVKLVVEQGMVIGKQFLLNNSEILVGRLDEENNIFPDIDLTDQDEGYVSRSHAMIEMKEDKMFITHLSKTNPTLVNKKPIPMDTPIEFKIGDTIKIGKVVLRVQSV